MKQCSCGIRFQSMFDLDEHLKFYPTHKKLEKSKGFISKLFLKKNSTEEYKMVENEIMKVETEVKENNRLKMVLEIETNSYKLAGIIKNIVNDMNEKEPDSVIIKNMLFGHKDTIDRKSCHEPDKLEFKY
ncbi:MAG: hypothetical protein ABIG69_11900 [Bacteroidota bacterium]